MAKNQTCRSLAMRQEHPRPDFVRADWRALDGWWQFQRDPGNIGTGDGWHRDSMEFADRINVPFAWQSRLSGIEDTHYTGIAWYRTTFDAPEFASIKRTILHFQAVDYQAQVWLNGSYLGEHEGGYDPFSFDITETIKEKDNVLTVRVEDPENLGPVPHGKQGGDWYTRVSGIWQPVWLEGIAEAHLQSLWMTPDSSLQSCQFAFRVSHSAVGNRVRLHVSGQDGTSVADTVLTATDQEFSADIRIPDPRHWRPDDPHLYSVAVTVNSDTDDADEVRTYFGMRSVRTADRRIYLNDAPLMVIGVLNQGYHPDGLYTYPSAEVMERDLRQAKQAGFNLVRFHIKPEEPRMLFLADALGLLVWEEPANFGDAGYGPEAKRRIGEDLDRMIRRDYNHPSVIIWGCLNETWGLRNPEAGPYSVHVDRDRREFTRSLYNQAKQLDPTRLVVDNSPCNYDHVVTDLNDWHAYWPSYNQWKWNVAALASHIFPGSQWNYVPGEAERGEPMLNSECGAVAAHMGDRDVSMPLRYVVNELRKHEACQGYIYTEMQDIEWEKNGVVRYDRSAKEFGYELRTINAEDFIILDAPPVIWAEPGGNIELPLALSLFSQAPSSVSKITWEIGGTDWQGDPVEFGSNHSLTEPVQSHSVTWLRPLALSAPESVMAGRITIRACTGDDRVVAENFVGLDVSGDAPAGPGSEPGVTHVSAHIDSPAYAFWSCGDEIIRRADRAVAFAGKGHGRVEYHIDNPSHLDPHQVGSMRILLEASAFDDTPHQTDENTVPTEIILSINDVTCGRWTLPDSPVDSRGILSWRRGYRDGAYGYLKVAEPGAVSVHEILKKASITGGYRVALEVLADRSTAPGGLILFGERLGRYPLGLLLELRRIGDA